MPAPPNGAAAPAPAKPASAPQRAADPLFPVGVTLYPLDSESLPPEDAYARDQRDDLSLLAEADVTIARVLVSWRALEPQVGRYDTGALERLSDLCAAARERRIRLIVCFFADDRHADLSEPAWAKRRDPRTDSYLIQREIALVQRVVEQLRSEAAVMAWQLGNEAFLSGFADAAQLDAWIGGLRDSIRELDADRPIIFGGDPETLARASAIDARGALGSCDMCVAHATAAYRAYAAEGPITDGPATYLEGFLVHRARGRTPVLLDDIGVHSLEHSASEEAAVVRTSLWTGFMNRASGALLRRMRDMETEHREPYFLDPFEALVGIVDAEGAPKASFAEVRRFIRVAAHIDLEAYSLVAERTAVMVPASRFEPLPSLAGLYGPRACFMAYVIAKQAHVPVTVVHEDDDLSPFRVLIVPSALGLGEDGWDRLASFVQSGGTIVVSYGGGDVPATVRELFGVDFLGDGGPRTELSCRVAHEGLLGALSGFDVKFASPSFALLSASGATVVATDALGSPLLTLHQVGQGRAVLIALPLERAMARQDAWSIPAPVARFAREVYGAAVRAAGCAAPVRVSAPELEVALFQGEQDDVLVLLNHAPSKVTAQVELERRVAAISDVRGDRAVPVGGTAFQVTLDPNGASALKLTYG